MKRHGNIYSKIYDIDNLKKAHKYARKNKAHYRAVKEVDKDIIRFEKGQKCENYLGQIHDMLKNHTYEVGEYEKSIINDKGKERELMKLPYFPDRIIQWAIMLQIEDIFMKTFCHHTCASIDNRGIKRASVLMNKYLRDVEGSKYCLKIDIKHFYPNINHDILKSLLRRKFKDKELLELLDKIIDSVDGNKGIPIGSYLSQFLGNFYLSYFDHWLKEDKSQKYVIRYMDDVVILGSSKEELHKLKREIDEYLMNNLDLEVKHNWQIFPSRVRGIDFVGYIFYGTHTLLRKGTYKRFKSTMNYIKKHGFNHRLWHSYMSYGGWLYWCNSNGIIEKYINPIRSDALKFYKENIKNKIT